MRPTRWYLPRAAAALGVVAVAVLACTDGSDPVAPKTGPAAGAPGGSSDIALAKITCVATLASKTIDCGAAQAGGANADIIYGGQNKHVAVTSANPEYDATTHKFTFDVRVRNLIGQAIGTTDGTTADGTGIKVWFSQTPVATVGTGSVTIDNADGTGVFTAPDQPYYSYVALLDQYQQSGPRTWQFDVPPTVGAFSFVVYISSPVQFPHGWIEMGLPTYALRRTYSKRASGKVFDQYGNEIPTAVITWSSADATLATVTPDSGMVTGQLPGTVSIVATSTNGVEGAPGATQTGASQFTITGTSLVWTAGAGSTDWTDAANWDRGVSPVAQDSVTVPVLASALYPVFTGNQSITDLTVADGASVSLGAFNLTAAGNVTSAPFTGGIVASSGRLVMTGAGKTVAGRLPFMQVSGTYSMTSNVNGIFRLRVDGGRVRNSGARIRISGQ